MPCPECGGSVAVRLGSHTDEAPGVCSNVYHGRGAPMAPPVKVCSFCAEPVAGIFKAHISCYLAATDRASRYLAEASERREWPRD